MYNKKVKLRWNFLLLIYILFSLFGLSAAEPPQYDNLALGIPGKCDTLIDRPGYALGYIEYHEQAAFVIYKLTAREALTKEAQRTNRFRRDPEIPTGSATTADYRRSGYDRGHLAPAADMAFSVQTAIIAGTIITVWNSFIVWKERKQNNHFLLEKAWIRLCVIPMHFLVGGFFVAFWKLTEQM